jgi:hypothetical protein
MTYFTSLPKKEREKKSNKDRVVKTWPQALSVSMILENQLLANITQLRNCSCENPSGRNRTNSCLKIGSPADKVC